MAALNITSHPQTHTEHFQLKNTEMTEDRHRTLHKPTKSRLNVENDLLYRKPHSCKQLVLPATYKQKALTYLRNNMGHVGVERVLSLAQECFYWPFMKRDIEECNTRKCRCIKQKKPALHDRAPMVSCKCFEHLARKSERTGRIICLISFTRTIVPSMTQQAFPQTTC